MTGLDSHVLRARLARAGFRPSLFRYHSSHMSLADIAGSLAATLRASGPKVHVVGHSLGGVIALETFLRHDDLPPGRVVLMGAPVRGARAASALAGHPLGRGLLGPLACAELGHPCERRWSKPRDLGLVAGTRSIGLGRFFASFEGPNDGTVALDETDLPGAVGRAVHDVSHIGMLFSSAVADSTVQFLMSGKFGGP
jgi:pimeloyl-ACP methyl ester carboxylesterase